MLFRSNAPEYCILHWLTVLLQNREFDVPSGLALEAKEYLLAHFSIDYENFDAIIGYRADDSYFSFAQDFINGTISYRQLNNAMYLGKLGQQFVLKSKKAFDQIQFVGSEIAESSEWYEKNAVRQDRPPRNALKPETNLKLPRQKNINKAQAEYLVVLAKVLCCEAEDLMEKME